MALSQIPGGWNGWPSGLFTMDISVKDFKQTKKLQVNWAMRGNGGDPDSSETASTIHHGKISNRQCLGVIRCENPDCKVVCHPGTTAGGRNKQLKQTCRCGSELKYFDCASRSYLIQWSGGYRYMNGQPHNHSRLSYVLHMMHSEEIEFQALIEMHPNLGPAALMLGPRRLEGYGKGAADISEATRHPDHVKYERRIVKSRTMAESGHWFLSQFSEWQRKHPGIVRTYQNTGEVTVISIQTTWMRDMLVPDIQVPLSQLDDALNGLLSDAAHGYWSVSSYLLIVTSVFLDVLSFWVPGLFTISNGLTAEHYCYHFKGMLESISEVTEAKKISIYDEMFAGVVDFNSQTRAELMEAAKKLLKGCQQYFCNAATRVKRLGGVVPPDKASDFMNLMALLYSTQDITVFNNIVAEIRTQFPRLKPWLNWWLCPDHASMIFPSQRRMEPLVWDVLPDSTNAEEAMHFKIYMIAGKKPDIIQGLDGLLIGAKGSKWGANKKVEDNNESEGTSPPPQKRLRVGKAPVTNLFDSGLDSSTSNIPSPHDTPSTVKKEIESHTQDAQDAYANMSPSRNLNRDKALSEVDVNKFKELPSYPWRSNSCWLDASLEALYSALNYGDWNSFENLFDEDMKQVPPSLMYYLYLTMRGRRSWPISTFSSKNGPAHKLQTLRDGFHTFLYKMKVVDGPEDLYQDGLGWFQAIISPGQSHITNEECRQYFVPLYQIIELCPGHSNNPALADHIKVHRASREHSVVDKPWIQDFDMYQRQIKTWFRSLTHIMAACKGTAMSCWRGKHCSNKVISVKLWTWIPVILTIEPANMEGQSHFDLMDLVERNWDFPCTLAPLTLREAKEEGLEYVVVSCIFKNHNHFITRSIVPTQGVKPAVFTYDGMEHAGFGQLEHGSIEDLMTGASPPVPKGYYTYAVIYRLCGGPSAQDYFASRQLELVQK
ncbi:hypothetical protein IW262DRAFT_1452899 [Armillaria fumosa]|nr:hypothetical protein IW262DRAFT_1452899 [Armillaria fumosa]